MSLETPLHRVQGLGASHSGMKHFWRQRMTAAALVPLSIWFAWSALGLIGASEAQTLYFLSRSLDGPLAIPMNAILMGSFVVILLYHMVLGLQVVIDDYVHGKWGKISLMFVVRAGAVAVGAVSLYALLSICRTV